MKWRSVVLAFIVGVVAATLGIVMFEVRGSAQAQRGADPAPGTKLSVEELKKRWFDVSVGRKLRPKAWPNNAKTAVTFAFDVNATGEFAANLDQLENTKAQFECGQYEGVPRILRLLKKHGIPATFFVPAVTAIFYPQTLKAIIANHPRDEVALHGWMHENHILVSEPGRHQLSGRAARQGVGEAGERVQSAL